MIAIEKLQPVSNRVYYEFWMLHNLANILNQKLNTENEMTPADIRAMLNSTGIIQTTSTQDTDLLVSNNARIESFGIHARALLDFFYGLEILEKQNRKRRTDDVFAEDFFDKETDWRDTRPVMPDDFEAIRKRVNKEIAHITYHKTADITPKTKSWLFSDIKGVIEEAFITFRELAPKERLGERWNWRWQDH